MLINKQTIGETIDLLTESNSSVLLETDASQKADNLVHLAELKVFLEARKTPTKKVERLINEGAYILNKEPDADLIYLLNEAGLWDAVAPIKDSVKDAVKKVVEAVGKKLYPSMLNDEVNTIKAENNKYSADLTAKMKNYEPKVKIPADPEKARAMADKAMDGLLKWSDFQGRALDTDSPNNIAELVSVFVKGAIIGTSGNIDEAKRILNENLPKVQHALCLLPNDAFQALIENVNEHIEKVAKELQEKLGIEQKLNLESNELKEEEELLTENDNNSTTEVKEDETANKENKVMNEGLGLMSLLESNKHSIYSTEDYSLMYIDSCDIAKEYGKGTTWDICYSDEFEQQENWDEYSETNAIFFVIPTTKNDPKSKIVFVVNRNNPMDIEAFNSNGDPITKKIVAILDFYGMDYSIMKERMVDTTEKGPSNYKSKTKNLTENKKKKASKKKAMFTESSVPEPPKEDSKLLIESKKIEEKDEFADVPALFKTRAKAIKASKIINIVPYEK